MDAPETIGLLENASGGLPGLVAHMARDLVALCRDPGDLEHGFDLLNRSYATPAAAAARARLKADPLIAPLVREHYWGPWPGPAELMALPPGSLGHTYGHFLADQGLGPIPDPRLAGPADDDDHYLQLRVRRCHDVWHVIAGMPATFAGEAGMNGVTTEQLRWPGTALLIAADLIHRINDAPDGQLDVGLAIAFGLELGATSSEPLLAQRWEQGWQRPLAEWRHQLGLSALLERSPFAPLPGSLP